LLPKKFSLSKKSDIEAVKSERRITGESPLLYFVAKKTQNEKSRLAAVLPKRLGKAVFRNKIKRRLASAFMRLIGEFVFPVDIVAYPRTDVALVPFEVLVERLKQALVKQGIL